MSRPCLAIVACVSVHTRNGQPDADRPAREVVLVGGGHAHVQVLRRWMMSPPAGAKLTLIVDHYDAIYSGMVPGFVAGDYSSDELTIDVLPLARRAGAGCIRAAVIGFDPDARRIELAGRPPIHYDLASIDIGSSVRDIDLPGVREHAIATRPIGDFVRSLEHRLDAAPGGEAPLRVSVVGAGAAGLELAFCLEARLTTLGRKARIQVLSASSHLLPGGHHQLIGPLLAEARTRSIEIRSNVRARRVEHAAVIVETESGGEERIASDLVLWATGAAPHGFVASSGLATDDVGYIRVRETLQVVGYDDCFAVGDCARHEQAPELPRAGVHAVRQGPVLDRNLRALLSGGSPSRYRPQRDFLALLNLGNGHAIGGKWGLHASGGWVFGLKDRIDRRFMRRFQVMNANAGPATGFPGSETMADDAEMVCGGCAAKVGASPLSAALARLDPALADPSVRLGLDRPDDAAAYTLPGGETLLATVDGFRAFSDDAWLVGRVAAVNAASDVLAKGGRPRHALAIVTVPAATPVRESESLFQVLAGVRSALDPLGISLVGGHSTSGPELFVGLSITGEPAADGRLLPLDGLHVGDRLILTKPLGTGVALAADMRGRLPGRWALPLVASLLRDNRAARDAAVAAKVSACTDVSGFGLAGHLLEMLDASGLAAELDLTALPVLPGALELLAADLRSSFHEQNAHGRDRIIAGDSPNPTTAARIELLFDPQTSGGLLFALPSAEAPDLIAQLHAGGDESAAVIGRIIERASDAAASIHCPDRPDRSDSLST